MYAVMLVTGLTEDVVLHLMPHPEAFLSKNNIEKL
jgi:phosphoribosylformylglycinamidine (FGAM) synthase-like amidotransferase family enzyme